MKTLIFGASGGLASAIAEAFLDREWGVDLVTRRSKRDVVEKQFVTAISQGRATVFTVDEKYSSFSPLQAYQTYVFPQALFRPAPLPTMDTAVIEREIDVGLTDVIRLVRELLARHPSEPHERRDYCFIGSTSSYAGFKNTSVYCAIKHGILGFVRAMNDEFADTDTRFWLFSMGTVDTEMGRQLTEQDRDSFLQPAEVAARIAEAVCSRSNVFQPEVIFRRRSIRFIQR